jgi:nitrous oxidase accessory protein
MQRRSFRHLASIAAFAAVTGCAHGAEWQVKPGESIQAAIAHAAPGDTIRVARGHYPENLRIDKPVKLIGVDRPTIDGGGKGDTVRIVATDVSFEGFIVADSGGDLGAQNAGVYIQPGAHRARVIRCDFSYTLFGLWIEKADDVLIENNLITGKRDFDSSQRATASSSTTPPARASSATTSASCATRSTWMSPTRRSSAATRCTTAATAPTT